MPIDYSKYHPDFKSKIRPSILQRAKYCCEQCRVKNYSIVRWDKDDQRYKVMCGNAYYDNFIYTSSYKEAREVCNHVNEFNEGNKWIVIVLTIAHLDHDITNNEYSNLKALCQRCHLSHDKDYHIKNAKLTIDRKKGIQKLF